MKSCSRCKATLPLDAFNKKGLRADGKIKYQSFCRECNKVTSKAHYISFREKHLLQLRESRLRRRKAAQQVILGYLRQHPCVDCGESDIVVLEFDHLSDKTLGISVMVTGGYKKDLILKEIAKCEVVCANCHRRRTYKRQGCYRNL